jgi:hypothetical protein
VITDGDLVLAESGNHGIHIAKHGDGRLPLARPSRFCAIPLLVSFRQRQLQRTWGATWCFAGSISLQTIPSCWR